MAKRSDMLKDKLNALKPSIPTNTRGEAIKETEEKLQTVSRVKQQETTAFKKKSETRSRKTNQEAKPAVPEAKPRKGVEVNVAVKELPMEYAFVLSDLIQENLASLSRIRDVMVAEANNMNSMYMKSCWKSMEACYDTALKTCGMFTPCSFGKWPFKFID